MLASGAEAAASIVAAHVVEKGGEEEEAVGGSHALGWRTWGVVGGAMVVGAIGFG